jgi:hypothetical protein
MRSISRSGLVCVLLFPEAAEVAPVATALTRAALRLRRPAVEV